MIHEWRSYRLKPGAAGPYLALLADEGLPLVTRHLPLAGYWLGETGPLNTIHHLWSYADWTEREACRASLATEAAWVEGFIPRAFALVEEQENRFLHTVASSPAFEAVVAARRKQHPARAAGAPLFAPNCAALISGGAIDGAIATWAVMSGRADGPFSLLPRNPDPVPSNPLAECSSHIVLRPLAFSPL
jgi:hypothetical protein